MRLFDSHLHIIDPAFPLVRNQGFLPEPFTVDDYLRWARPLGIVGGTVVSGSFQGADQAYLRAALDRLGPAFVGVTNLSPTASEEEIRSLDAAGVRAVRFNLRRGGPAAFENLGPVARRVHALVGWHVELYTDARHLDPIFGLLTALPAVVVDHLGLSKAGLSTLVRLVEHGVYVKASGFGRVDFDVVEALRALHAARPGALLFGTDLPSTRAPRPFRVADLECVVDALGVNAARRVCFDNAVALYRPRAVAGISA